MRILHLVSCRGWSSDAYWAARVAAELERRGHVVTLGCRAGTDARVIDRARTDEGVTRTTTFAFASGLRVPTDARDVRALAAALREHDVVHVHRGKEHWLAAVANRVSGLSRPLVRTRHITQAVRSHAGNRWLYGQATDLVVAVTDAIRRQLIAGGVVDPARIVTLTGGVDAERYRPGPPDPATRGKLGGLDGTVLVGMVSGFRLMKGQRLVIEAAARLRSRGVDARFVLIGKGPFEGAAREAIERHGVADRVTIAGYVDDPAGAMRALDVGLYVPLESEGMSRVVWEALASGQALVASRVGVIPELLVDREHAWLVPAGDVVALADAIATLAGDPALRERLGRAARRLVEERCSGARVAEALESAYARLGAGHDATRAA